MTKKAGRSSNKHEKKAYVFIGVAAVVSLVYFFSDASELITLNSLKQSKSWLEAEVAARPWSVYAGYFLFYLVCIALSIPGAAVLSLAAGALFGLWKGVVLVSFASSLGALLAFLICRYFLRDFVKKKFPFALKKMESGIERDGLAYLFSLRLLPIFPFFLINLGMGLTSIRAWSFYWVGQLAMIPGTFIYVHAGVQIAEVDSMSDILSWDLLAALALLAIFPWLAKGMSNLIISKRKLQGRKKPSQRDYNVVVIGAGAGGLVASYMAALLKAKVALIEEQAMGGDCLNTGCVPSKALLSSAKVAHRARNASKWGIDIAQKDIKIDFARVMERVQQKIQAIAPHDSVERYEALGVECVLGRAEIVDPFRIKVNDRVLTTNSIVLALGASPIIFKFKGYDQAPLYTSETIWQLRTRPEHLVIVGAGPIGCELAQGFRRLGVRVSLVERGESVLQKEEPFAREAIEHVLLNEGVELYLSHTFECYAHGAAQLAGPEGEKKKLETDAILWATGRRPNTRQLSEELGVELRDDGSIKTNAMMQTTVPNVFACGDVSGPYQLTHAAGHQAFYAATNALFAPVARMKIDYDCLPWCTFTDPELARVGASTAELKDAGIAYEVSNYDFADLDRAIVEDEEKGLIQVLSANGSDRILGVTILGSNASDLIAEFALAKRNGLGLQKILKTIHLYPSFAEANKYVAGVWKKAHTSQKMFTILESFHQWRR